MERFLWICLAGAMGTGARVLVGQWIGARTDGGFPWATFTVNTIGCFAMGFVMHAAAATTSMSPTLRLALTTGFLGGFTTYSAFNHDTTGLVQDGARGMALTNLGATVAGCVIAGWIGLALARRIFAA
jgi:CrcB protein